MGASFAGFFMFNVWMDFLCVLFSARMLHLKIRAVPSVLSALAGGFYALAALFLPAGTEGWTVILSCFVMGVIAFASSFLKGSIGIALWGFMLSGAAYFLESAAGADAAKWGMTASGLLLLIKKPAVLSEKGKLTIYWHHQKAVLSCMGDTGNLLRDRITNLPVIVAPFHLMTAFFPSDKSASFEGLRLLSARTAAGCVLLPCFHPDLIQLETESGEKKTLNMLIAVTREKIPRALVPAEMMTQK